MCKHLCVFMTHMECGGVCKHKVYTCVCSTLYSVGKHTVCLQYIDSKECLKCVYVDMYVLHVIKLGM